MVLATQNPVDLDYKAISNAGTWMIGRLQTERDKARLLEGMSSAAGTVDMAATDATISALAKREFLLHTTGGKPPADLRRPVGDVVPVRPALEGPDPSPPRPGRAPRHTDR